MTLDRLDDPTPPEFGGTFRRAVAQRVRQRRRRRLAVGGAASAVVLGVGAVAIRGATQLNGIDRIEVAGTGSVDSSEPQTMLLIGTDGGARLDGDRTDIRPRADAVTLVRFDPSAGAVRLLSLPRDLVLPPSAANTPEGTSTRLSEVMVEGGVDAVVAFVEQLGFGVDHVAVLDMAGFRDLVDDAGGIELRFDAPTRDRMSGLDVPAAGCHHLDGAQALAFVRARHLERQVDGRWVSDGTGDLGRTSRQRAVLSAALVQARSSAVDPLKLDRWASWAQEHLTLDATLDTATTVSLLRQLLGVETLDTSTLNLPLVPAVRTDGSSVLEAPSDLGGVVADFSGGPVAGTPSGNEPVGIGSCS
jgi:LCP family protein required for cell wall assembly